MTSPLYMALIISGPKNRLFCSTVVCALCMNEERTIEDQKMKFDFSGWIKAIYTGLHIIRAVNKTNSY